MNGENPDGAWHRHYYGVPACVDMRVKADGHLGRITGFSGPHIMVLIDGEYFPEPWHPTWRMEYLEDDKT